MINSKFNSLTNLQKSVVINAIIMFLWWLAFNPGFYSADSFGIIDTARSGKISSESTAIWAIVVKIISINGSHPEISTLFFSQLLGFSLSLFAHSILKGKIALWASAVLCTTPLVGAMGITLWHDIPMTSGFLLFVASILRYKKREPYALSLLTLGVVLSSFRYNGIPTLLLTTILLAFFFKPKRLVVLALVSTITIGGLTAALDSKFSPPTSTHSDGFINWMRYDLSCYAASSTDNQFFQEEFEGKSDREFWKSSQACTWFNDSEAFFKRPTNLTEYIPTAWLALTLKDPLFVLTTHMKRHEYLNPLPFYGPPIMPFIHTTIEYPGQDISFLNANLSEKLRVYPRIWNFFNFIFGYSGFWLLLLFFLAWRKKHLIYFGVGVLGLVLNGGLFVFAIIPDARFSLFVLMAAQLILLGEFLRFLGDRRKFQGLPRFTQRNVRP
jgi:hypothetical protein